MVQLKIENPKIAVEVLLFQFQYGTIKTQMQNQIILPSTLFQFHNGTIKTCSLRPQTKHGFDISIP